MAEPQNLILLGDISVGKTSLAHRLTFDFFPETTSATTLESPSTKSIFIDNESFTIQIFDTAGQERYSTLQPGYYRMANCCMLTFDITSQTSFDRVQFWTQQLVEAKGLWHIQEFPAILIGNKLDLAQERQVDTQAAADWAQSNGMPYYEVSAKTGQNTSEALIEVVKRGIGNRGQQLTQTSRRKQSSDFLTKHMIQYICHLQTF